MSSSSRRDTPTDPSPTSGDWAVRSIVSRLARPHPSGGDVIERATILAEGADSQAVLEWVEAHALPPEAQVDQLGGGLHGSRLGAGAARRQTRFVLPAGVCDAEKLTLPADRRDG